MAPQGGTIPSVICTHGSIQIVGKRQPLGRGRKVNLGRIRRGYLTHKKNGTLKRRSDGYKKGPLSKKPNHYMRPPLRTGHLLDHVRPLHEKRARRGFAIGETVYSRLAGALRPPGSSCRH